MQSAQQLLGSHCRIAPSIRAQTGFVFAPFKCAFWYQNANLGRCWLAQIALLIAFFDHFSALFDQVVFVFDALVSLSALPCGRRRRS
jgi:hypothetical protein